MKNSERISEVEDNEAVVAELREIKKLLVLLLLKGGSTQREIATALGVNQATVSRRFGMSGAEPLTVRTQNGQEE